MSLKLNGSELKREAPKKLKKTAARKIQFHLGQFCSFPIVFSVERIMVKSLKMIPK